MTPILEDPKRSVKHPITSKEVKHLEQVPGGKFYEITYQLGPSRSYAKSFGTGKWKNDTNVPIGEKPIPIPVYAVFSRIVDSGNANGMIEENNSWREKNIKGYNSRDPMGALQHMLAVIDVKELKDYVPSTMSTMSGVFSYELFQAMVAAEVRKITQPPASVAGSKG